MKIKGEVSMINNGKTVEIHLEDGDANIVFCRFELNAQDFMNLLSNRSNIKTEMQIVGMDKIGKTMEHKKLSFEMPPETSWEKRKKIAEIQAAANCPEGWIPDNNFSSQDSFFRTKDGKEMAQCTIRRYV